jgi:hypothetical protein
VARLVGLDEFSSAAPLRVAALPLRMSLQAWQLAHELLGKPSGHRLDLEFAERAACWSPPLRGLSAPASSG